MKKKEKENNQEVLNQMFKKKFIGINIDL